HCYIPPYKYLSRHSAMNGILLCSLLMPGTKLKNSVSNMIKSLRCSPFKVTKPFPQSIHTWSPSSKLIGTCVSVSVTLLTLYNLISLIAMSVSSGLGNLRIATCTCVIGADAVLFESIYFNCPLTQL